MEIEVKNCTGCPLATHNVDFDQDYEWLDCDLLTVINGHEHDSHVYCGDLSDGIPNREIKSPSWCPLKKESVTIKMSSKMRKILDKIKNKIIK